MQLPCGKLISHPVRKDDYAIGFLPLPFDLRGEATWEHKDWWVLLELKKGEPRSKTPEKKSTPIVEGTRKSMRKLKDAVMDSLPGMGRSSAAA